MKRNRYSSLVTSMVAAGSLLLGACSMTPVASRVPGYLTTPKGALMLSQEGQCWRTAEWRPALAIKQCDPEVVAAREAEEAAKEEEKKKEEEKAEELAEDKGEHKGIDHAGFVYVPDAEQQVANGQVAADVAAVQAATKKKVTYRDEVIFAPLILNSDASFRFGDDHLTPEGRDAVVEMAGIIKARKAQDLKISVVGHTDRVGTDKANQDLSRRRAATVKTALIAEGIPAAAIDAGGMGSSMPVTQPEDCPNYLVKCELIDCLRPDRRVEIRTRGKMENGRRQVPVESRVEFPRRERTAAQREEMQAVCKAG